MQLSEHDLILLNSYLDDRLGGGERARLETRLSAEPALQAELDALRDTVQLLRMTERVRVPRNFTLDPARYGRPVGLSWLERIGFVGASPFVTAGAALAVVLMCAGALLLGGNLGLSGGNAGQAPVAMSMKAQSTDQIMDEQTRQLAPVAAEATESAGGRAGIAASLPQTPAAAGTPAADMALPGAAVPAQPAGPLPESGDLNSAASAQPTGDEYSGAESSTVPAVPYAPQATPAPTQPEAPPSMAFNMPAATAPPSVLTGQPASPPAVPPAPLPGGLIAGGVLLLAGLALLVGMGLKARQR